MTPEMLEQLTLDTEPWLSCDECFRLVDRYAEDAVAGPTQDWRALEVHLRACPACSEEASTIVVLVAEDAGVDAQPILDRLP